MYIRNKWNGAKFQGRMRNNKKRKAKKIFPGLPQLGYSDVEPIILDELHIALGGGPNGYKAQFKEITARGVSAVRVTGVRARLSDEEVQLQLALSIPKIRAAAKYRSSGTLILVQASGAGDYWGEYGWYHARLACLYIMHLYIITDRNFSRYGAWLLGNRFSLWLRLAHQRSGAYYT